MNDQRDSKELSQIKVAVIVGPTAVGKSEIAIEIALRVGGEIISGDAFQVYRGLDIGTAKVNEEQMKGVHHHLLDIAGPHEAFSVAQYQRKARQAVIEINAKKHLPIIVGGSGLYIRAVIDDLRFPSDSGLSAKRDQYENMTAEELFQELKIIDHETAKTIDSMNKRRLIRALEKAGSARNDYKNAWHERKSIYDVKMFGLTMDRARLYARIERRVDKMMSSGLIEEVLELAAEGLAAESTAAQALGYRQVIKFLTGSMTKNEMVEEIKKRSRNFAKRQLTWFNADPRIEWFDIEDTGIIETIVGKIARGRKC